MIFIGPYAYLDESLIQIHKFVSEVPVSMVGVYSSIFYYVHL